LSDYLDESEVLNIFVTHQFAHSTQWLAGTPRKVSCIGWQCTTVLEIPGSQKAHLPVHHIRKFRSSNSNVQLLIRVMLATDLIFFSVSKGQNCVAALEGGRLAASTADIGNTKLLGERFPF
jgi:hypothetical protein